MDQQEESGHLVVGNIPSTTTGKTVCVSWGKGCSRAKVDTARYVDYFELNGWTVCDSIEDADVVLVMTCGFSGEYEESSIQLIAAADRRRRSGSQMLIAGCLAAIDPARLRASFDAYLISRDDGDTLDDVIKARIALEDVEDPNVIEPYIARATRTISEQERRPEETRVRSLVSRLDRALVTFTRQSADEEQDGLRPTLRIWSLRVAQGCMGACTYCAIRFSAGPLRSKPLTKVLAEFDAGLSAGYREYNLIAGDLGCYGQDIGTSIYELLDQMMRRQDDFRLTLLDFDPKWFIAYQTELIDLLSRNRSRIARILIPVQSGSEPVLARMRRGHTAHEAAEALHALRDACPEMVIDTQVLVGFPGESDADFQDTLDFLNAARFTHVCGYDYEDRPRTEASDMRSKVPRQVIRSRGTRLLRQTDSTWTAIRYYLRGWGRKRRQGWNEKGPAGHANSAARVNRPALSEPTSASRTASTPTMWA